MASYITPEMINIIFTAFVIPMLGVLTKFLVSYIQLKSEGIKSKIHSDNVVKYLDVAEDAVCTAVASISQTYVESLKKTGSFDEEAQKTAFNEAKYAALSIMGTSAEEAVSSLYGDLDEWLTHKIEYYINMSK